MRILMEGKLKCGCTLAQSALDDLVEFDEDIPAAAAGVRYLADLVAYWLETRMKGHECALVSEENPSGFNREKYKATWLTRANVATKQTA